MADSRCCFGCSNVRKGAWVISIFNMLICILLTIQCIPMLNFVRLYSKKKLSYNDDFYHNPNVHFGSMDNDFSSFNDDSYSTNVHFRSMEDDFVLFIELFILFLFFYTNLNLKKATYMDNAQSINQWLVINSIFFIFFFLYVGFTTIKNSTTVLIPVGIPVSIVVVCQIYVVKCFYDDELKCLANYGQNLTQPTLHGTPYVTVTSQTTDYPVQSSPYVIQQVHQPITLGPCLQQTCQYQPQPQPPQSHMVLPSTEPPHPQEYCNPPPYLPNYSMQEGSSIKQ